MLGVEVGFCGRVLTGGSADIIEDMYSPRTAAINFISELIRKRGKENLQKFLAFIVEVFRRYRRRLCFLSEWCCLRFSKHGVGVPVLICL